MKTNDREFCREKLLVRHSLGFKKLSSNWANCGLAFLLLTSFLINGCTSAPVPIAPSAPQYLDYLFPNVPEYLSGQTGVQDHKEAWRALQAGYLTQASVGFSRALNVNREFFPALAEANIYG